MNIFFCCFYILPEPAVGRIVAYLDSYSFENGITRSGQHLMLIPIEQNDNASQVNSKIQNAAKADFEAMFSRTITAQDELFFCGEFFR